MGQKASSDLNLIPPLVEAVFGGCRRRRARRTAQHCHLVPGKLEPGTRLLTDSSQDVLCLSTPQLFENRCFILNCERVQQHPSLRSNSFNKNNQTICTQSACQAATTHYIWCCNSLVTQNCDKFHSPEIRPLLMAICFRLSLSSLIFLFGKKKYDKAYKAS